MMMAIVTGCNKHILTIPSQNILSPDAREELNLPPADTLTRATESDRKFVSHLPPETVKAVMESMKAEEPEISINAARPVGDYLLLWISFPRIADGGIDLIWSVAEKRSVGQFLGGYRG